MQGEGSNNNAIFPAFMEGNQYRYDGNMLPQLQLFAHIPIEHNADSTKFMSNKLTSPSNHPSKRGRDGEATSHQQKLFISLNNNLCPDEIGYNGSTLNPIPVSTGLRLSNVEEERNSSITSTSENVKISLAGASSLSNNVEIELDRQKNEIEQFIKLQEQNILKGVQEINQRHTTSLLNVLEKGVKRSLDEKAVEIGNVNRKNKELGDRIKQVAAEAQTWHYRAKYNESVINILRTNIQQHMAQGTSAQGCEGSGDSEVDSAASYVNNPMNFSNQVIKDHRLKCKACKGKEVSVLLLPCRHLCLCIDCDGFIKICPLCQAMKTASFQVYMS